MNGMSLWFVFFALGVASSLPALKFSFVINRDTTLTIKLGKSATIDCSTDDQGAKVTLYKLDGNNYREIVKGPNVFVQNGVFSIKNTFFENSGRYLCKAVDQLGNKITKTVFISLDTAWAALAVAPATHYLKVYAGDDFKLTCEAIKIGVNFLKWEFKHMPQKPGVNDYTITAKQVSKNLARSVLYITKAKKEFTGYYQCRDSTYAKEVDEVFVEVIVPKAPSFKQPYHETKLVKLGQEVDLDCELVQGSPKPDILWKKDGQTLSTCKVFFLHSCYSAKYLTTNTGLKIKAAAFPKDNGTFSCVASNEAGTAVKTVDVNIKVRPQLMAIPSSDVLSPSKKPFNITCKDTTGNPPPKFTWKMRFILGKERFPWMNDLKILTGHKFYHTKMSSTLTVPYYVDHAEYKCTAVNIAGKDSTIIKFIRR